MKGEKLSETSVAFDSTAKYGSILDAVFVVMFTSSFYYLLHTHRRNKCHICGVDSKTRQQQQYDEKIYHVFITHIFIILIHLKFKWSTFFVNTFPRIYAYSTHTHLM